MAKKEDKTVSLIATPTGGKWSSVSNCNSCLTNSLIDLSKIQGSKAVVRYTYTASNGCISTKDITITKELPPTTSDLRADFKIYPKYCEKEKIKPENNSVGAIEYVWKINNIIVSTEQTPSFDNLPEGLNQMTLVVSDKNSKDSLSQSCEIIKKPKPFSIVFDKNSGCSPLKVNASYPTFPAKYDFQIDWGDGIIEQITASQHTYLSPIKKEYTIKATVKNQCGMQVFSKNIQVVNNVRAILNIDSINTKCSPTTIKFTNNSEVDGKLILSNGKTLVINAKQTLIEIFINNQTFSTKLNAQLLITSSCGQDSSFVSFNIAPTCNTTTNTTTNSAMNVIVKDSICHDEYLIIKNIPKADKFYWEINNQRYEMINPAIKLPVGLNLAKLIFVQGSQVDSLIFEVSVLDCKCYLPAKFTPNGDGWNDWLYITANSQIKKIHEFLILNRWGEIVFSSINQPINSQIDGWDGFTNGKKQPEDVYFYQCFFELFDGKKVWQKGNFDLIR